jgi:ABC-type bacteriocin/lantibiotic exporter with double-glycine peptidase domain
MYDVKPVTTEHPTACGPAALKMLLDYYGQTVELADLISECEVSVTGCTAAKLLQVGRAHGLAMTAWETDAEDVLTSDRPAILWWRYTHFVVFCGLNEKDEPVICNPSSGRFPIARETFERAYSGKALYNGTPADFGPRAEDNYKKDQVFRYRTDLYIALQPIARGEKLVSGWNCKPYSITEWINDQKQKEE